MRPTEERSIHGYWDGDDRPDPLVAQSAPEFVAQLRTLVQWSGLALEEIEQLARANGDILPPSIVSAALSHNTLPPEEVVVALVAAIGDDDEMVEQWASVLWRLEEDEAARYVAPLSAPPPSSSVTGSVPVSSVTGSRQYSGGALAQAVQKRRNQNSWTGLHRSFQKGLRATGFGAKLGRGPVSVAIGATLFVLVAGVAWGIVGGRSGDGGNAEPRSNPCCVAESSAGTEASAGPEFEASPNGMPMMMPLPGGSTKPTTSPTPKASPTRNSPTPTRTQTQLNPDLNGSGSASACRDNGNDWVVDLTVTATLTGAQEGNDPQGRGGKSGDLQNVTLSGTGTTSFNGQLTGITVGPHDAAASGSLQWSVTVTVPGAGPVSDNGTASYTCSLPG
ncbi:MAG TPA: hypothetical protein VFC19_33290 [Candidatus Limnocylindrales bacterium]|nr:hypothetical protein [Candidatus Limnocylindrales bacterium]